MFELGLDQADGLKQLFIPQLRGRVNVIGVSTDSEPGRLAVGIGKALMNRGYDVRWDDPAGLLPGNLPCCDGDDLPQIVVSATLRPELSKDDGQAKCSIFAARPHPSELRLLYSSMKAADSLELNGPFTVLWCGKGTEDPQMRRLCETNLSETVAKFLRNPVEFIDTPRGAQDPSRPLTPGVTEAHFLERLSSMLLNRLGYVSQPVSNLKN
jgi:hypothetical protein